jgi:hypothetical protein
MMRAAEFPAESSLRYIQQKLAVSDKLGVFALATAQLEGRVFAFVPQPARETQEFHYQDGGIDWDESSAPFRAAEREFIRDYLRSSENAIAVFEGWCVAIDEQPKPLIKAGVNFFLNESSLHGIGRPPNIRQRLPARGVYLYGTSKDENVEHTLLVRSRQYPTIGVLTTLPPGQKIVCGATMADDFIRDLATRAQYVFVGAFDEEARLIWEIAPQTHR